MNLIDELMGYVQLRINHCGTAYHEAGWSEMRTHPDYDVWLVTEGEVSLDYQGKLVSARKGDVVFFNPGIPYTAYCSDAPCSHLYLHFDFSLGQRFNVLDEYQMMGVTTARELEQVGPMFQSAFHSYVDKAPMASLLLKGSCYVLLSRLLTIAISQQAGQTEHHPDTQSKQLIKLKPVMQYIEDHMGESITAERMAEMIDMSPKYFYSFFKANIGLTPQNYITRIRMNRARALLSAGELTIKEIAYQLGYADPYTFSKVFKRMHKTSPSKFFDHT